MDRSSLSGPALQANTWFFVGLASSFPDILGSEIDLTSEVCELKGTEGCKIFRVSDGDNVIAVELVSDIGQEEALNTKDLKDQVLIFQYNGKLHAMENVSLWR